MRGAGAAAVCMFSRVATNSRGNRKLPVIGIFPGP